MNRLVENVAIKLLHTTCDQYGDERPSNPDLTLTSELARAAIKEVAAHLLATTDYCDWRAAEKLLRHMEEPKP